MYYYWLCDAFVFFFKQKTAYEMRISDWSSDVCSSDLRDAVEDEEGEADGGAEQEQQLDVAMALGLLRQRCAQQQQQQRHQAGRQLLVEPGSVEVGCPGALRSEEHTSELQSLMRSSYAVFCLKKKKSQHTKAHMRVSQN